jgi:hypothetical protein
MTTAKAKGGRPRLDRPTGRKVTLYMLPADEAKAKQLGAGNVSLGVRMALHRAADSGSPRTGKGK